MKNNRKIRQIVINFLKVTMESHQSNNDTIDIEMQNNDRDNHVITVEEFKNEYIPTIWWCRHFFFYHNEKTEKYLFPFFVLQCICILNFVVHALLYSFGLYAIAPFLSQHPDNLQRLAYFFYGIQSILIILFIFKSRQVMFKRSNLFEFLVYCFNNIEKDTKLNLKKLLNRKVFPILALYTIVLIVGSIISLFSFILKKIESEDISVGYGVFLIVAWSFAYITFYLQTFLVPFAFWTFYFLIPSVFRNFRKKLIQKMTTPNVLLELFNAYQVIVQRFVLFIVEVQFTLITIIAIVITSSIIGVIAGKRNTTIISLIIPLVSCFVSLLILAFVFMKVTTGMQKISEALKTYRNIMVGNDNILVYMQFREFMDDDSMVNKSLLLYSIPINRLLIARMIYAFISAILYVVVSF